eukprot:CAMPEP_0174359694 /NCGR_PEP_ID=MMETSP0811_2-20130205/49991_1 /TAXON_ID=73025 ORGANISM="Eutreptiella gymnastica-like, Strain CCMP1594" /NCGR_SAMPLE_ID=MMETSP0811_2 /ASSEMBLY_ACC=CAM_ASM_000667 /LENGTH=40 /DNA_ID= /DNA_START= /DNA_END= /DNA_ORIENTATION=
MANETWSSKIQRLQDFTTLDLSYNYFGDEEMKAFSEALKS